MRLFLLTAVVLNLRLLLAVPMLDRRNAATSAQLTSDEQPSAGDDKVVSFLGGLAVGGTTGYFIGQQQERNINNPNRRPPPRANSPTPEATVNLPVLRAAPKIFHEAEIDEEMEKRRSYEKMRELQTRIYTTLQMDPDGFDWVYECKRLRNPGIGQEEDKRLTLEVCFEEYLRLKKEANGRRVPPFTEGENYFNEFRNVDLKSDLKTANPQPKQSFQNFMPSIDVGKLNWNAAEASALRQLQSAPKLAREGTSPILPRA